eukprot:9602688-Alexandrium_andersonii.AAC.1
MAHTPERGDPEFSPIPSGGGDRSARWASRDQGLLRQGWGPLSQLRPEGPASLQLFRRTSAGVILPPRDRPAELALGTDAEALCGYIRANSPLQVESRGPSAAGIWTRDGTGSARAAAAGRRRNAQEAMPF